MSKECRERFLPLDASCARVLAEHDLSLAGISDLRGDYDIGRVDANFHVLLYTLAGAGRLMTSEGRSRLTKGTLLILPAHTPHRYTITGRRWRIAWFHLKVRKTWLALDGRTAQSRPSSLTDAVEAASEGLLRESTSSEAESERAGQLHAETLDILIRREVHIDDDPRGRRLYAELRALWDEVDADLAREWDVATLARGVHMSRGHFHRAVRDLHGKPPMKIVTELRMRRAEALLRHTDNPVFSIATRVGYEDPFAFSVAFKRHAGVSPRAFRQAASVEW